VSAGDILSLFGAGGVGVVSVLLGFLTLFITGQVVTKREYEQMREERDEWRKAAELSQARSEAQEVTGRIVRDVMQGLRKELE